jgi:ankyrin repeat protein
MDTAPIQAAIQQGDAAKVRELVGEEPALLQARTPEGVSLVALACYFRRPDLAAIFTECGAILDIFDASAVGDRERVQMLIEKFPESINTYSPDGFFPLGLAAFFGHREIVEYLLDAGADVNQTSKNIFRVAAIHAAVSHGDTQIVRMLLDRGENINARQLGGYTPLHGAAGAGRIELIDLLLAHGADPEARSDEGKTPAELAEDRGHKEAAAHLRAAMARP